MSESDSNCRPVSKKGRAPLSDEETKQFARWRLLSRYIVAASGCWEYTGQLNCHGYGKIVVRGKQWLAHRLAYSMLVGEIPTGISILHSCDNRKCINPSHLFPGTQADNVSDMMAKGRHVFVPRFGESNPQAKLTSDQVADIRRRYVRNKVTLKMLGDEYGIKESTVHGIIKGNRWSR